MPPVPLKQTSACHLNMKKKKITLMSSSNIIWGTYLSPTLWKKFPWELLTTCIALPVFITPFSSLVFTFNGKIIYLQFSCIIFIWSVFIWLEVENRHSASKILSTVCNSGPNQVSLIKVLGAVSSSLYKFRLLKFGHADWASDKSQQTPFPLPLSQPGRPRATQA